MNFHFNHPEATLNNSNAPIWLGAAFNPLPVIDQGTWQWQGYSTECGAAAEHITEQDSTPEIDPAHCATFTSEGDNRGCNMLVKLNSIHGDLDRERSLKISVGA